MIGTNGITRRGVRVDGAFGLMLKQITYKTNVLASWHELGAANENCFGRERRRTATAASYQAFRHNGQQRTLQVFH